MPKFYVLKRVEAHKQGRRTEYTYLHARIHAPDEETALKRAREKYGEGVTVQRANGGYDEGK